MFYFQRQPICHVSKFNKLLHRTCQRLASFVQKGCTKDAIFTTPLSKALRQPMIKYLSIIWFAIFSTSAGAIAPALVKFDHMIDDVKS